MRKVHFAFLLTVLFLYSCKSKISLLGEINNPTTILFNQISNESLDYQWFSTKAKVRLESSQSSGGGRMNIRIIRDSLIWFNFKKVSIEGARGLINPETFSIIYRNEKKYEVGDFDLLMSQFDIPLSFQEIQFYLVGNLPIPNEESLDYKRGEKLHELRGRNKSYDLTYYFDADLNMKAFSLTDRENRKLSIELDQKDEILGIYLKRKLLIQNSDGKISSLDIDLSNVEINVPKKIPFSIPDHYTQF